MLLSDAGHYRDAHSLHLSTLLWSRFADRVGENRVKSLRSKRRIAPARRTGVGGAVGPLPVRGWGFLYAAGPAPCSQVVLRCGQRPGPNGRHQLL